MVSLQQSAAVCLDGRSFALAQGTGVATYATVLARGLEVAGLRPAVLLGEPPRPRAIRWIDGAVPGTRRSRPAANTSEGWHAEASPDLFRTSQVHFDVWRRLRPIQAACPPDLMHWTYPLPVRLHARPNLYTIHDLIPLTDPTLTAIDPVRSRGMLECIVAAADHVVTVSEATRQQLIATLGLAPDRVTNTWQAVDISGSAALPDTLVAGEYWLHVGTVERRKNLRRLVQAWQASGTPHPLVVAGPDGLGAAEELPTPSPGLIRFTYLPRPTMLALIRDARALLMPSLAEGFGLPVAEAMAFGTPVLTSQWGALAETAGEAALLIEPTDTQSIVAGLRALDTDPGLRAILRDKGLRRAPLFAIDAYASRLRSLYERILRR